MNARFQIPLVGLDGSNPLAFLATLGTLRILSNRWPRRSVEIAWSRRTKWEPVLFTNEDVSESELIETLHECLSGKHTTAEFTELGNDLTVSPKAFRDFAKAAASSAKPAFRNTADFAAAFGCESLTTEASDGAVIQDTALRTMAGAGHQHFLGFMRNIIIETKPEHLHKALLQPWRYDDSVTNLTLRYDPVDDVRYALQWRNPSGDPARKTSGSVLGANRLAIEGIACIATAIVGTRLMTVGFRGHRASGTYWTWPIWSVPASLDVVKSLISLPALAALEVDRSLLARMGIEEVYRSQRLTIGKVRNFTPGQSV